MTKRGVRGASGRDIFDSMTKEYEHAVSWSWRGWFHAAALIFGGERSCRSAAVTRSMTFIALGAAIQGTGDSHNDRYCRERATLWVSGVSGASAHEVLRAVWN